MADRMRDQSKEKFVRDMFSRIAPSYDLVNRIMSWGQDMRWRRVAVDLACTGQGRVLDVATGTGDLAIELARHSGSVVGLDFCGEMIQRGDMKARKGKVREKINFVMGDALTLPFNDNSFDCALNSFVMRNVSNISLFLSEMRRVVKPGGRVVCLELTRPASGIKRIFYRIYLYKIVPLIGRVLSGDRKAYRYLPDSVSKFINAKELQDVMSKCGFRHVGCKCLNRGTVAVCIGIK